MFNDFSSFFDIFILFPGTKNKYLDGKIIITVKEKMSKRSYNVNETLEIIFGNLHSVDDPSTGIRDGIGDENLNASENDNKRWLFVKQHSLMRLHNLMTADMDGYMNEFDIYQENNGIIHDGHESSGLGKRLC